MRSKVDPRLKQISRTILRHATREQTLHDITATIRGGSHLVRDTAASTRCVHRLWRDGGSDEQHSERCVARQSYFISPSVSFPDH